jgi:hypothetical protein
MDQYQGSVTRCQEKIEQGVTHLEIADNRSNKMNRKVRKGKDMNSVSRPQAAK